MLFYAAIHLIDGFLAGKHLHPSNHEIRDDEVESNGSLSEIYRDYRRLKDMGRAARYDIPDYAVRDLDAAKKRLASIKNHFGSYL